MNSYMVSDLRCVQIISLYNTSSYITLIYISGVERVVDHVVGACKAD